MRLCEHMARGAGSVARPGLALDWFVPCLSMIQPSVLWGTPSQAPVIQVWLWLGQGGACSPKAGWSEPRSRHGKGGLCPMAGVAAHAQPMQVPP